MGQRAAAQAQCVFTSEQVWINEEIARGSGRFLETRFYAFDGAETDPSRGQEAYLRHSPWGD